MTVEAPPERREFGKFTLLERIGSGGMAEIYKSELEGIDGFRKILVVKKILPKYADNRQFITMFVQEAKVCSGLHHANVVQIYELGEEQGEYYIAMEYVAGYDLLKVLTKASKVGKMLPPELCLFIISEVCKGLGYAHGATDADEKPLEIIHLDCSPSNILISHDGDVKLTDFGVARAKVEGPPTGTEDRLKGKLGYMSPEQVTGKPLDHRSDIFSLGIILYELFTLKRLFLGKTDIETLSNVRDANIEPRLKRHPEIPKGVGDIIRKALRVNTQTRYQSALDVEEAISQYLFEVRQRVTAGMLSTFVKDLFGIQESKPGVAVAPPPPPRIPTPKPKTDPDVGSKAPATRPNERVPEALLETQPVSSPLMRPPPPPPPPGRAPVEVSPEMIAPPMTPGPFKDLEYRFKSPDGRVFGPISYQNLHKLLQTRAISPDELVSVSGGDWRPIVEVTDIDRILPLHLQQERTNPDEVGIFGHTSGARVIARMVSGKRTGRFKLTKAGQLKEVFFRKGKPVHITSNNKDELFGALLVTRGIITDEQLHQAVGKCGGQKQLGDALIEMGLLDQGSLLMQLEAQFVDKFKEIFTWEDAYYEYYRGAKPPLDAVPFRIEPFGAITEGIRKHIPSEVIADYFGSTTNKTVRLASDLPFDPALLKFAPREHRVRTTVANRPTTVNDLLDALAKTDEARETVLFVLFILHQTEQIRLR